MSNIASDFEALTNVEAKIFNESKDRLLISSWLYRRIKVLRTANTFINRKSILVNIFRSFGELYKVLRLRSKKRIVFASGRLDKSGRDIYLPDHLFDAKDTSIYIYAQEDNVLPKNTTSSTSIRGLRTVTAMLAVLFFPLILIFPRYRKILQIHKNIEHEYKKASSYQRILRFCDYLALILFFKLIVNTKIVEEVHFVSRTFFYPLIYSAPSSLRTIEYSHAIVHRFHPAYSVPWLDKDLNLFPSIVQETSSSQFPLSVDPKNSKLLKFFGDDYQLNPINFWLPDDLHRVKCIAIISQPIDISSELKILLDSLTNSNKIRFLYCRHPRESKAQISRNKNVLVNSELVRWEDIFDKNIVDIVFGISSNVLVEAYRAGYKVLLSEGYNTPAMKDLMPNARVLSKPRTN